MRTIRFAGLPLWAALALACSGESALAPAPSSASALTPVTSTTLTGVVGMEMNPAPTVRATDRKGNPVQGVLVTFSMMAKGSVVQPRVVVPTTAEGNATVAWALGSKPGLHVVAAEVTGLPGVSFSVTATPGDAVSMTRVLATQWQRAVAGTALELPLSVMLTDRFNNPIADAKVAFTVLSGGGSIDGAAVSTDSSGLATSRPWTLGPTPGQQQVGAKAGDLSIVFTAAAMEPCTQCLPTAQLAFVRDDDIYVSSLDGSNVVRLTSSGVNSNPTWSPDGGRIAFSSDRGGRMDIYVMNVDGSGLLRRTNTGGYNTDPAWSPNGVSVAFSSLRDGQHGIYVMAVDGDWSNPKHVGPARGWNAHPAWSPDGAKIVMVSDERAYDFVYDLYVMNGDGSNFKPLLLGPFGESHPIFYFQPAWSPDGRTIATVVCAYAWDNCHPESSVAVMNADGSQLKLLARAGGYASPTWSPDGTTIAFSSSACRGCASSIRYVRVEDGVEGLLIANAHSPAWRP